MGSSKFIFGSTPGRMEEHTVNICLRVLKRKTKTRTIRIALQTPVMSDQTFSVRGMRVPIILKKDFILSQFYSVKLVRIIFVNMFLQIISITPCELAFNSLETHVQFYAAITAFTE